MWWGWWRWRWCDGGVRETFTSCALPRRCSPWLCWWWWFGCRSPSSSCTSPACYWRCRPPTPGRLPPGRQQKTNRRKNTNTKTSWWFSLSDEWLVNKQKEIPLKSSLHVPSGSSSVQTKEDFMRQLSNVISLDILSHFLSLNHDAAY